jgi:hypothetical protein
MCLADDGSGRLGLVGATAEDRQLVHDLTGTCRDHPLGYLLRCCADEGVALLVRSDLGPLPPAGETLDDIRKNRVT